MSFKPSWPDPIDLNPGDLCVYVGSTEFSSMSPRVIYRVIKKEETGHSGTHLSAWHFTFEPIHDMFPTSHDALDKPKTRTKNGSRGINKLSLLDLGKLRADFDEFLIKWANT